MIDEAQLTPPTLKPPTQTLPFSHAFGVSSSNNSPFSSFFSPQDWKNVPGRPLGYGRKRRTMTPRKSWSSFLVYCMNIEHLVVPQLSVFTIMLCSGAERWLKPLNLRYFKKKKIIYDSRSCIYIKNNYRISIKCRSCQINVRQLLLLTMHALFKSLPVNYEPQWYSMYCINGSVKLLSMNPIWHVIINLQNNDHT